MELYEIWKNRTKRLAGWATRTTSIRVVNPTPLPPPGRLDRRRNICDRTGLPTSTLVHWMIDQETTTMQAITHLNARASCLRYDLLSILLVYYVKL